MNPSSSSRRARIGMVALAQCCLLLFAAPAPAQDASEQRRPIAITNVPNKDLEDLDLGPRQGEALRAGAPDDGPGAGPGCSAELPSGGVAGQRDPKGGCEARSLARAEYDVAVDWAHRMWCEDPVGRKAAARGLVQERLAGQKVLIDRRDAALAQEQARLARQASERAAPLAPIKTLSDLISGAPPRAQEKKVPIPEVPYYDASHDMALAWDARESGVCRQSPYLPVELGPSIAQAGQGKIATPSGACEAILVESTLLSGRAARSRLTWIASRCPGYAGPDAKQMAEAVAGGEESARAWQKAQLLAWKWSGAAPREAMARSADAP